MSRERRGRDSAGVEGGAQATGEPGRRTLTQALPVQRKATAASSAPVEHAPDRGAALDDPFALHTRSAPVQAKGDVDPASDGERASIKGAAASATAGGGGPMPFLGELQRGFGHHDLSDVRAHTDGAAAAGTRAMGAEAFASGRDVAFAGAPDLFTAAHEAAHVVQQRAGVDVDGGVGRVGDRHEQHADQVAARVVAGQPAVDLLDAVAPRAPAGPAATGAIQRKVEDKPAAHPLLVQGAPKSADVELLQTRLNEDGAKPPLDVDGWFGPLTHAAVVAFQGRHGLSPDGQVGLRTWGVLDELKTQGIAGPTKTVLDKTKPVSQEDHDFVEGQLHPTIKGGKIPAMTGAGVGAAYETEMLAALDDLASKVVGKLAATPAANMGQANQMADLAQTKVQGVFGSSMVMASRKPTGNFHPGSSRMGLADATTRPVDHGTVLGWTEYFMDNGSYKPGKIQSGHNYDNSRPDDHKEHDRVRDLWLNTHGGESKCTAMIRAWPAEAGTGTVFIQLRDPGYQDLAGMWSLFATLIHEFMHLAAHPNYTNAADLIGGAGRDVLIEGMDEHMTQQAWNAVRPTIVGDTNLRKTVEGTFYVEPPDPTAYAAGGAIDTQILSNHYDSMTQADAIAGRVGEDNARAAYFMGHVEAIGLGPSSKSETPLTGIASWAPGAGGTPDQYPVATGGETVQQVRDRTGVAQVEDTAGTTFADPAQSLAAGTLLHLVGVRWHTGIAEDTRGQVANQHGIGQPALERANKLSAAPATTPVAPGTLLLIPAA